MTRKLTNTHWKPFYVSYYKIYSDITHNIYDKTGLKILGLFKSIYNYWSNTTDTPSIQARLNMFFFVNIRIFKIKLHNYISFMISNLSTLKFKEIKVYYNVYSFEIFYIKFLTLGTTLLLILLII